MDQIPPGRSAEVTATSCYLCTDMRCVKLYEIDRCNDTKTFQWDKYLLHLDFLNM